MATKTILLDVGGTFIKCSDGRTVPIDSDGSREQIAGALCEAVGDASDVAVAIPGPFDYANGIFLMKHKFASVYGERFADLVNASSTAGPALAFRTGNAGMGSPCGTRPGPLPGAECGSCPPVRFRFVHDVVAMLMGEVKAGAGRGYSRVALVTLGTGLGFAISIDGKPLLNEMGSPLVPIWNIPYRDGILEDYASKRGFLRGFPEGLTVKDLAENPVAADAAQRFAEVGGILAEALAPILAEYGIECLLFGGQISRSYHLFGPALEAGLTSTAAPSLRHVGPVSDIGNATFNGLRYL